MPKRDGISLAREIRKKGDETMVIYTSSTTEYAMDAFGIHALGYLLKPVEDTIKSNKYAKAAISYYMFFLEAGCKIKKKEEEAWVCEKK